MSADHYRLLLEYNHWANTRILTATAQTSETDYLATFPGLSFGSLHATLVHALVAEIVWLARWQGSSLPEALKDARIGDQLAETEIKTFAELRDLWATEEAQQSAFIASLTDDDLVRPLAYKTQCGEPNIQPLE